MSKQPYLNLGCGITYDERWTNIDFVSTGEGVRAHNLLLGIPEPDQSFGLVYHSHVLEHFPKEKAEAFLRECFRVLKPGGIIRIAIPDLEQIARNYLQFLEDSLDGKAGAKEKYEWSKIEMLDQMVRNTTGGEMLRYVTDRSKNNDEFRLQRHGAEMKRLFEAVRGGGEKSNAPAPPVPSLFSRAKSKLKRELTKKLLGDEYELLQQARFRNSREIHQWMYDRFSLAELLKVCGFNSLQVKTAFESAIPGWSDFKLDGENGIVRKPDSLFMEAVK
jgi:predicted SAM-dependent methyltransferase